MTTPKNYFDKYDIPVEPGYVFVLLQEESKAVYEGYIKKAVENLSLKCESFIDLKLPTDALEDVLHRIRRAEILIIDISDFNPNVMWELGVALTIKSEDKVIVIRRKDEGKEPQKLPFNIYHHRISCNYTLDTLDELRGTLIEVISKMDRDFERPPLESLEVRKIMDSTKFCMQRKDWVGADIFFDQMNQKEPQNWYIFKEWGIMFRIRNEFQKAIDLFLQAIDYAKTGKERVYVYIELAKLYQVKQEYNQADAYFKKAEQENSKNRYLYLAYAEFYDEVADYFNAQMKIGQVLRELNVNDPEYKEFKTRFDYYTLKINDKTYIKSLDEYKRELNKPKPKYSDSKPLPSKATEPPKTSQPELKKIPWDITWEDLQKNFAGEVVDGKVNNIVEQIGIFVTLSRDFSGLISRKVLDPGFEKKFVVHQPIKVRLKYFRIDPTSGKKQIVLAFVEEL